MIMPDKDLEFIDSDLSIYRELCYAKDVEYTYHIRINKTFFSEEDAILFKKKILSK